MPKTRLRRFAATCNLLYKKALSRCDRLRGFRGGRIWMWMKLFTTNCPICGDQGAHIESAGSLPSTSNRFIISYLRGNRCTSEQIDQVAFLLLFIATAGAVRSRSGQLAENHK